MIDNTKIYIGDIYSKNTFCEMGKCIFDYYLEKVETHTRLVKKDQILIKVRDWYVPLFYIKNEIRLKEIISQEHSKDDLSTYGDEFIGKTLNRPVGYFIKDESRLFNFEGKQSLQKLKILQQQYDFEQEAQNEV